VDINDLRGLSTVLMLGSFLGLCVWAYSKARTEEFNEAANLPFADEPEAVSSSREKGDE
jgi:cytochrome c oxidase cbb3-type subunit IV